MIRLKDFMDRFDELLEDPGEMHSRLYQSFQDVDRKISSLKAERSTAKGMLNALAGHDFFGVKVEQRDSGTFQVELDGKLVRHFNVNVSDDCTGLLLDRFAELVAKHIVALTGGK